MAGSFSVSFPNGSNLDGSFDLVFGTSGGFDVAFTDRSFQGSTGGTGAGNRTRFFRPSADCAARNRQSRSAVTNP